MEFDPGTDEFILTPRESVFFGVPDNATRWPLDRARELEDRIILKRDDLAGAHATAVDPAQRRQEVADLVHAVRMTRNAFQLIARVVGGRAVLSDDDIVRLLGGDE